MNAKLKLSGFKQQEINKLLRSARRVLKHPGFDILIAPAALSQARILVIISAKLGSAVARNTFRRRWKELFRKNNMPQSRYDWIVIAKKPGLSFSYHELESTIQEILKLS